MKKKVFALLLVLTVMFTMCFGTSGVYAASGTAITTAEELKAMESNPSGSYYLANDIDVPANLTMFTEYGKPFTGAFDGNGYKLNGYSYTASSWVDGAALFVYANGASFKNINMTDVSMSFNGCGRSAALCAFATGCSFSDIKVSGKITSNGAANIAGVLGYGYSGDIKLTNVKNSASVEVKNADSTASAAGVAGFLGGNGVLKKCTNSAKVSVSGPSDMGETLTAAGVAIYAKKLTSCKNSAAISITAEGNTSMADGICVAGVAATCDGTLSSCGNSGKIKLSSSISCSEGVTAAGLVGEGSGLSITKSWNKGSVSFSGKADRGGNIGGLAGSAGKVSQSYNKAAVTAKLSKDGRDGMNVGGICGYACDIRNSYNTGQLRSAEADMQADLRDMRKPGTKE